MELDLDLTSFNGGGGMECSVRSMSDKRSKSYEDPARIVSRNTKGSLKKASVT